MVVLKNVDDTDTANCDCVTYCIFYGRVRISRVRVSRVKLVITAHQLIAHRIATPINCCVCIV